MPKITTGKTVWTRKQPHQRGVVQEVYIPSPDEGGTRTYRVAFVDANAIVSRSVCKPSELTMTDPNSAEAQYKRDKAKRRDAPVETELVQRIRDNSITNLALNSSPSGLYGSGSKNVKSFVAALTENSSIQHASMGEQFLPTGLGRVGSKQLESIIPALASPNLQSFSMKGYQFTTPASLQAIGSLLQGSPGLETLVLYDTILVGDAAASHHFCQALSSHRALRKVTLKFQFRRNPSTGEQRTADIFKYAQDLNFDELLLALANIESLQYVTFVPSMYNGGSRPMGSVEMLSLSSLVALIQACHGTLVFSPAGMGMVGAMELSVLQALQSSKVRKLCLPLGTLTVAGNLKLLGMLRDGTNTTLCQLQHPGNRGSIGSFDSSRSVSFFSGTTKQRKEIQFWLDLNGSGCRQLLSNDEGMEEHVPTGLWPHILAKVGSCSPSVLFYFLSAAVGELGTAFLEGDSHGDQKRPAKRAKLSS